MISMQGGHFVPIPFSEMIDSQTGRTRVRMVNINSTRYAIARRYMIRLRRDDFEDPHELAKFAATSGLSLQEFRKQFEYLIELEPPPLALDLQEGLVEHPPHVGPRPDGHLVRPVPHVPAARVRRHVMLTSRPASDRAPNRCRYAVSPAAAALAALLAAIVLSCTSQ